MTNIENFRSWLNRYDGVVLEGAALFGILPGVAGRTIVGKTTRNTNGGIGTGVATKVAAVLTEHPKSTAAMISQYAGVPVKTLQAVLTRMRATKTIRATGSRGHRLYSLTLPTATD